MILITDRKYRGLKRDTVIIEQVRRQFLKNKVSMLNIIQNFKNDFENAKEFNEAKAYIASFFEILLNDKKFRREILN